MNTELAVDQKQMVMEWLAVIALVASLVFLAACSSSGSSQPQQSKFSSTGSAVGHPIG